MSVDTLHAGQVSPSVPHLKCASARELVFAQLCRTALQPLPRSDQRTSGRDYVRGLLATHGRKSIRNIAGQLGGAAAEQRLHHFVCDSTWDWRPVRRSLAEYVTAETPPEAWVVYPVVIPKAGENSVGVDRRFFPSLGQLLSAQEACGVWAAWGDRSVPVNWRLHLSARWLDDPQRRRRAAIPDDVVPESLGRCAVEAYLGMMADWGLPVRPVTLDGRGTDVVATIREFTEAGVPVLIRISGDYPLPVERPTMPGWGPSVPAYRITAAVRNLARTVLWRDRTQTAAARPTTVTTVRIRPPAPLSRSGSTTDDELLLVGIQDAGQRWSSELWLTTMVDASPPKLLRLTKLTCRVARDLDEISDPLGIRDFTGRSFGGWHRHVTLASIAHAITVLSRQGV